MNQGEFFEEAYSVVLMLTLVLSEDAQGRSMTLSYESAMEVILAQFFIINVVTFIIKQLLGV